jgi:hypothetical protein
MLIFFLFGLAAALIFLLPKFPLSRPSLAVLALLELLFIWKIAVNLAVPVIHIVPEKFESLAILFVWHHWLLLAPVPVLLAATMIILAVYRERIVEEHAAIYRRAVSFFFGTAFVLFILSVMESIF